MESNSPDKSKPKIIIDELKAKAFDYDENLGTWSIIKPHRLVSDMSAPTVSTGNFIKSPDSLHLAFRPIIILAQCFSVFPVNGISSPNSSDLKFTWRSIQIVYFAVSVSMSLLLTVYGLIRIMTSEFTSNKLTTLVFSSTSCLTNLMFLRLAKNWSKFINSWEKMERELVMKYHRVSKLNLANRFKIITAIIMTLSFIEHALSLISGYVSARECSALRRDDNIMKNYFIFQFPYVFNRTSYAAWKGVILQVSNILNTFLWNFLDLFIILLSVALTYHFSRLNERLNNVKDKVMPDWWWAEARCDFNRIANLTRLVDSHVSVLVFLSFGVNLYFICIQLMFSIDRMPNVMRTIYFCYSFGFLLGRTIAVSLSAASVHDESHLPAPILYSISSSSYSTEIARFLTQVTTDRIGLTGMNFFSVTRSLVLTVAGTIVTYELVLVQFNAVHQSEQELETILSAQS